MTADNQPDAVLAAPKQSLTVSTLWLMVAKACAFLLGIAVPMLMYRRLDRVQVGHYNQIFQLISTACSVLPFGFGMTAFYFFPREHRRQAAVCLNILLVCGGVGLLAGAVLLLCPWILPAVFSAPELLRFSPQAAVLIPLWITAGLLETFPVVNQEFRLATLFIIGSKVSWALCILTATIVFGSVRAIVYAAMLHASLQTLVLFWYLEVRLPGFWRAVDWELLRSQLRYAAPLGLAGMLYAFQGDLHNYFVSNRLGTVVFAVYSVGCLDLPLIGILCDSAGSVMIRRVGELQIAGDTGEIIALTARVARKLAAVFFPVYAFLLVSARELITIVATTKYLDSVPIFRVNCTILLLAPILVDPICRAYPSKMPLVVKVRVVLFVGMAVALWLLLGRFGAVAAITIVVCRSAIESVFGIIYYGHVLGMTRRDLGQFSPLIRIAIGSAAAGLVAMLVRQALAGSRPIVMVLVCGTAFCAVYAAAILIMRVPTREERRSVVRTMAKWVPLPGKR